MLSTPTTSHTPHTSPTPPTPRTSRTSPTPQAAFAVVCLLAALAPTRSPGIPAPAAPFPGWPATFEGRPLRELPRSERERRFERDFPGRIARFTDGRREIVLRWLASPSRTLHPAADCFRGLGYAVTPGPLVPDWHGRSWGSFAATKGAEALQVREQVADAAGRTWSDVSAWYWSAALGRTQGPWWAMTVAERGVMRDP